MQGSPVDMGGYYKVDKEKVDAAMRPSPTLNAIIDASERGGALAPVPRCGMAVSLPTGEPLIGSTVRLDRMTVDDGDTLDPVLANPDNYADGYVMAPPTATVDESRAYVAGRLAVAGPEHLPYVGRLVADGPLGAAGTVVGTSTIGDVDLRNERAHIGWTMWDRRFWGTAVNPEAKLLMLGHLFDDCGFGRVKIQTDAVNHHSQAAIAKLGAQKEGAAATTHAAAPTARSVDTVVFSVVVDEWPTVKAGLEARLRCVSPMRDAIDGIGGDT